jgi:hypothetical protein
MKKVFFLFLSIFTRDKLVKKYIKHNLNHFTLKNRYTKKSIILVEFNGWSLQHIIISYIANFLANKFSSKIYAYPGYVLDKYTIDFKSKIKFFLYNFFPIKQFLIYTSFGTKKFFYPSINSLDLDNARKIYLNLLKKINSNDDVVDIKINNVPIGDLIYDSYLKFYKLPTLNISKIDFKNFLFESIKSFLFWENYLKKNNVKGIVFTHTVYSGAVLIRIAAYKYPAIKLISGNSNSVYNFNKNNFNPWLDFRNLKNDFNKLTKTEKMKGIKLSKKLIEERINGIENSNLNSAKSSPYSLKKQKRAIKKSSKIKILVATHCFLDSPHIYGKFFFSDFMIWLNFLNSISKMTNYDWYIKSHPNFNPITYKILKAFVKKNRNFKILPLNYNHKQIISEGINFVLTVHGTIGWEYAYMGIPVINASKNNPHYQFKFNINPKSLKEYKKILLNLDKLDVKINKLDIIKFYLVAYIYYVTDWLFRDQKELKKALKDFNKTFEVNTYGNWINSFNLEKHQEIKNSLNRFIDSKRFKILQKDSGYNLTKDILSKKRFTPKT